MVLIFGEIHSTINIYVLTMVRERIHAAGRIDQGLRFYQVAKVRQLMTHGQLMEMVPAKKLMIEIVLMNVLKTELKAKKDLGIRYLLVLIVKIGQMMYLRVVKHLVVDHITYLWGGSTN